MRVLLSMLGLGFLMGMQHAMEADHVAAVSSIVSRRSGIRHISLHGAIWGLGHTLTLLVVAGGCIVFKASLSEHTAERLELGVGLMLVGLGAHVLWRLWQERIHFGMHTHADGVMHAHAHSHRGDIASHAASAHDHAHPPGIPWRTLMVGTMHGMAGSAAMVVLAASAIPEPVWGIVYVVLFGVGSVIGMAILSAMIALPLTWTAKSLSLGNRALQAAIGLATIVIGLGVVQETFRGALGLA